MKNKIKRSSMVQELVLKGYTESQISKKLNVSVSTIYRIIRKFRESNKYWLEELASKNLGCMYRENLEGLKQDMVNLHELLEDKEVVKNKSLQVKIIKNISDLRVKYAQLLGSFPTIWSLDLFIKKNNPEAIVSPTLKSLGDITGK